MFEISFIIAIILIGIVVTLLLIKGFLKGDPCCGCSTGPKTPKKTKESGKQAGNTRR